MFVILIRQLAEKDILPTSSSFLSLRKYGIITSIGGCSFVHRTTSLWLAVVVNLYLKMYFLYFLKSLKNGKVYVGSTSKKPEVRLDEHNSGTNQWTRQNRPFKLIYFEKYHCLKDAKSRELFYKTGVGKVIKKIIIESFERISR